MFRVIERGLIVLRIYGLAELLFRDVERAFHAFIARYALCVSSLSLSLSSLPLGSFAVDTGDFRRQVVSKIAGCLSGRRTCSEPWKSGRDRETLLFCRGARSFGGRCFADGGKHSDGPERTAKPWAEYRKRPFPRYRRTDGFASASRYYAPKGSLTNAAAFRTRYAAFPSGIIGENYRAAASE